MTQDKPMGSSFHVNSGETVTVTLTPVHCQNLATASFNGTEVDQTSPNSNQYAFQIKGASADTAANPLVFACTCNFADPPAGSPAPFYSISVQSAGGKAFDLPPVHYAPHATFTLNFMINA